MVERQARDLEVRASNPGPDSNFSLKFKSHTHQTINAEHTKALFNNTDLWTSVPKHFCTIKVHKILKKARDYDGITNSSIKHPNTVSTQLLIY